jgi:long-chain fatty acid transport protein
MGSKTEATGLQIKLQILALIFFIVSFPFYAYSGGIILYEISSADTRLASAGWSARAEDPSTAFTNPAGMSRFSQRKVETGMQAIYEHVVYDPDEATVSGGKGNASWWFPGGGLFYVQPINECWSVGISCLAYFGADLNYRNQNWAGRYYVKETYLQSFSLIPAIAYRFNECLSVGVGANVMYGIFRQKSYINNIIDSLPDGRLKLHDVDLSGGAVVGILYEPAPCTRFGIQYLSPVKFRFHDTPKFENIGPRLTEALTRTGLIDSKVNVNVTVPQSVMLSAYHDFNPCWSVMGNLGWQQWSEFNRITVNVASPDAVTLTSKVKYQDTWHVAIGAEYHWNENWTLSGGVAYDSSAVSNSQRRLDFAVGKQWRFGTGARWQFSDALTFDLCYELMWSGNLPADVNAGSLLGDIDGEFKKVFLQFIDINLTWAF